MPTMDMEVSQRLTFQIGPAQLLLAELLCLPAGDLTARLESELDTNPALDLPQPLSCNGCGLPLWRRPCPVCRMRLHGTDFPLDLIPTRDHSHADVTASVAAADRWIAEYLLSDVDSHGLLSEPLPNIASRLGCAESALHRVIGTLRLCGLPGFACGTLQERLSHQASEAAEPIPAEVNLLLQKGLDSLASGQSAAALATGLTVAQVAAAVTWLRTNISADISTEFAAHIEPPRSPAPVDVLVHQTSSGLAAEPIPGPWSAARVAPAYLAHSPGAEVTRAARFVEALARRESLLTQVCGEALQRQTLSGPKKHLSRREIATTLGVHESTVSRTVAHKHLLLPSGEVITFASLFGNSDSNIRQCLLDLVATEALPQSDTELAHALARRGHVVARRTIAKYRAELGIPHQRQRHRRGGQNADQR